MKTKNAGLLTFATLALGLSACGQSGPDMARVRLDFDNPTGSVKEKNAVLAANGKAEASGPAISLGSGGTPGALTAEGTYAGLRGLTSRRVVESRARALLGAKANRRDALRTEQFTEGSCDDAPAAVAAWESLSSGAKSASYSLDLSSCSGGELTGSVDVNVELETNESSGKFTLEQKLNAVCETSGNRACVDGTMVMELSANAANQVDFLVGWDLDTSWREDGETRQAKVKGGLRFHENGEGATMEILVYVTTPDGEELSYVLSVSADETGATLSVRGSDGEINCEIDAAGAGQCTDQSGNVLSWTAEEASNLDDAWLGE